MGDIKSKFFINSIFRSIQGEGFNQGKEAVFIRFSGCNLWSGLEKDRFYKKHSCANWCDTDFKEGSWKTISEIVNIVKELSKSPSLIVLTGGEPMLQITQSFIDFLKNIFSETLVCIETNGTIDKNLKNCWTTVSPKEGSVLRLKKGNELKFVYPQSINLEDFLDLDFDYFIIQPKYENVINYQPLINLVFANNKKLIIRPQLHKILEME